MGNINIKLKNKLYLRSDLKIVLMRKHFTTSKYIKANTRKSIKVIRNNKKKRKYDPNKVPIYKNGKLENIEKPPVSAPVKLQLFKKTEDCVLFFNKLKNANSINKIRKTCFIILDLSLVEITDYSTVSVLIAIINDLKAKNIIVRGNYPENTDCKNMFLESGLLNVMYDDFGKKFEKVKTSDFHFIENGSKKLTREDNKRISETVKNVVEHLTGSRSHCIQLRKILLEICGNSIEWGGAENKQWLLAVKYEKDQAIFTVTDVGKGILNTLYKKFGQQISDYFFNSNVDVLMGAFEKKYGSRSKKANRNKGLPAIRNGFEENVLCDLKVLTNNVILHFDNKNQSKEIKGKINFGGTLYRWTVNKKSLNLNYE